MGKGRLPTILEVHVDCDRKDAVPRVRLNPESPGGIRHGQHELGHRERWMQVDYDPLDHFGMNACFQEELPLPYISLCGRRRGNIAEFH